MASQNQAPIELPVPASEVDRCETPRRSAIRRPKLYYGNDGRKSLQLNKQPAVSEPSRVYEIKINGKHLPIFCPRERRKSRKPRLEPTLTHYTELMVYARNIPLLRKICRNKEVSLLAETDLISEALKNSKDQLAKDLNMLRLVKRRLNGKGVRIKFVPINVASCEKPASTEKLQPPGQQNRLEEANVQGKDENAIFTKLSPPWFCDSCFSQVDGLSVRGMKLRTYFAHYRHFSEVHGFKANSSRCEYCGSCMQEARLIYHRYTEHGILPPVGILENLMCLECGNVAQNETALQAHKELHEKGHQCSVCQEPFEAIQDLLRHLDHTSHQTEPRRSYTCPSLGCSQVFFSNSLLVIHTRMSHKELSLRFDLEGWPPFVKHEDKLRLTVIEGGVPP